MAVVSSVCGVVTTLFAHFLLVPARQSPRAEAPGGGASRFFQERIREEGKGCTFMNMLPLRTQWYAHDSQERGRPNQKIRKGDSRDSSTNWRASSKDSRASGPKRSPSQKKELSCDVFMGGGKKSPLACEYTSHRDAAGGVSQGACAGEPEATLVRRGPAYRALLPQGAWEVHSKQELHVYALLH